MEAKKKYVKPAFRFVTDLGSILECLYEVYGTDGELLLKGEKLSDTVICPFVRMVQKKCSVVDAEILHLMLWKIYMVSARKSILQFLNILECSFYLFLFTILCIIQKLKPPNQYVIFFNIERIVYL